MDDLGARVRTAHGDAWEVEGRLRAGAAEARGIRLMASGLPHAQWNNGDVTSADADIGAARAFYAERGVPWGVRVPAGMAWPHGRHLLTKRLMGLPAPAFRPAPVPPGLALRPATPDDLDVTVRIDAAAFGEEPELERAWAAPHLSSDAATVALGLLDGMPVATGYALRSDGRAGPCLYVAGIAVLREVRGRGVGAALTSWLLAHGFSAGAELAHLHPEDERAARLYARLGFVEVPGFDVYVDL